jgi:excisionase family DNA binding protein
MPPSPTWLTASQAAARLQVSAKTVTRWANQGRLQHRRTLGGHRRFDPELIDALVQALTYRPNPTSRCLEGGLSWPDGPPG